MRFHWFHKWEAVSVENYRDTSYCKPGEKGSPSFTAIFRCVECGEVKAKTYYQGGFTTVDELNGVRIAASDKLLKG